MLQAELVIFEFKEQKEWEKWLNDNPDNTTGIWIRMFKKDSGRQSITRQQALEEALCNGWIDGQAKKFDDASWLQKFTPRRKRSMWSKVNIEKTVQG